MAHLCAKTPPEVAREGVVGVVTVVVVVVVVEAAEEGVVEMEMSPIMRLI